MKAIVTIGAPASGKSTWARECLAEDPSIRTVIERDTARMRLFNLETYQDYKFSKANEAEVTKYCRDLVTIAGLSGMDLCISDTNLNEEYRKELVSYLESLGYEVELKVFDVDFFELVKRDEKRHEKTVGRQVVYNFYKRMQAYLEKPEYDPEAIGSPNRHAYIFDIDGTIADMTGIRKPFDWHKVDQDRPILPVIDVLESLWEAGNAIVLLSGRDGCSKKLTEEWLDRHAIPYDNLFMRAEGDNRKDSIIKKELFDNHVAPKYHVRGVFDDRPQVCLMWQELGLPLFKVGDMIKEF